MTRKLTVALVVATALGLATGVFTYCSRQPATIHLRFTAVVGDKGFVKLMTLRRSCPEARLGFTRLTHRCRRLPLSESSLPEESMVDRF